MYVRQRLDAFIAFAELENFTHAAKRLHLSQPALFAQISKFEDALGVPLYERKGRNVALTSAGIEALAFARDMRERVTAFEARVRGESLDTAVVLCAGRGSYLHLLGPAIRHFRNQTDWSLTTLVRGRDETVQAVLTGKAHIGVTAALTQLPAGLSARIVRRVEPQLAMHHQHPFAKRRRLKLTDLAQQPLIAPPLGRAQRDQLEAACHACSTQYEVVIEADGWDLMLHFVALGLGVAVVNDGCALPPEVVTRPLGGLPGVEYVMLARTSSGHPGAQPLADAILAACDTSE